MELSFSPYAERDLDEIRSCIERERGPAAATIVVRILQSIGLLGTFPAIGLRGAIEGTRELQVYGLPYKAIYRIELERLCILAIVHTCRTFPL